MSKPITPARVKRLNAIMYAIQLKPMPIKALYAEVDLGRRAMLTHIRMLLDAGKIVYVESPSDRRYKVYRIAQGALPFDVQTVKKDAPPPKKRGPKPGSKRPVNPDYECRKVKTIAAQQIGIARDPLVAAFFGTTA